MNPNKQLLKFLDRLKCQRQYLRYFCQAAKAMRREGWGSISWWRLVVLYPRWLISLRPAANSLDDARPWMPFSAIRFLERLLTRDMRVFEYGAGGSSIFFANRALEVISVDHDKGWADRVQRVADSRNLTNLRIITVPPEANSQIKPLNPADPDDYVSSDADYRGYSFQKYAASIDSFPPGYFNMIVIDGRARPSCFKHACPRLPPGGWLVLDNAERPDYRQIHQSLRSAEWREFRFAGPGPYTKWCFWQTSVWQKAHHNRPVPTSFTISS